MYIKKIFFSLFLQVEYDFTGSILIVQIIQCVDLPAMDIGGTSGNFSLISEKIINNNFPIFN